MARRTRVVRSTPSKDDSARPDPGRISVAELTQFAATASEHDLRAFFVEDSTASGPFAPAIRFDEAKVAVSEVAARSEAAMNWANRFCRFRRRTAYMNKLADGYEGLRIVSEGDSWFQYPILLDDTIDYLMEDFAICSLDAAGDTLINMDRSNEFVQAIRNEQPDVFLFSGGGNDVLGGGHLEDHLRAFDRNLSPVDHILPSFAVQLGQCMHLYRQIITRALAAKPDLRILIHGYDHPIPRKDGRWLGMPMIRRGIVDPAAQRAIAQTLIDRFNSELVQIAAQFPGVIYVNQRGAVGTSTNSWHDELHPNDQTYRVVADRFKDVLDTIAPTPPAPRSRGSVPSIPSGSSRALPFDVAPSSAPLAGEPALALHIGLNSVDPNHYAGWVGTLAACEADADDMYDITTQLGYKSKKLTTSSATRAAVIEEIRSAAQRLAPGGIFTISYSGHGGQMPDFNGDESDSIDETWCLFDGELIDDELAELWTAFPPGARVFFLSDSCHSGTAFRFGPGGAVLPAVTSDGSAPRAMPPDVAMRVYRKNKEFYRSIKVADTESALLSRTRCSVLSISGCQDNQLSADGPFNGRFTASLLTAWNSARFRGSYRAFHQQIKQRMPSDQTPELRTWGAPNDAFVRQNPFQVHP